MTESVLSKPQIELFWQLYEKIIYGHSISAPGVTMQHPTRLV
jgi:hypothetical protein